MGLRRQRPRPEGAHRAAECPAAFRAILLEQRKRLLNAHEYPDTPRPAFSSARCRNVVSPMTWPAPLKQRYRLNFPG